MNDRELLEMAARVAGIPGRYHNEWAAIAREDLHDSFGRSELWRPLDDDGDAFRLMVALGISPEVYRELSVVEACTKVECFYEKFGEGVSAAAAKRRAIVRAAEAMGEKL